jgi:hypothetical protein
MIEGDIPGDENMESGNEATVFRVERGGIELSEP